MSCSALPCICSISSSVSLPHCSRTLPFSWVHWPLRVSRFIRETPSLPWSVLARLGPLAVSWRDPDARGPGPTSGRAGKSSGGQAEGHAVAVVGHQARALARPPLVRGLVALAVEGVLSLHHARPARGHADVARAAGDRRRLVSCVGLVEHEAKHPG